MHSRKKGKSRSKKVKRPKVPEWVSYSAEEVEEIIEKLAKNGNSPSKIGLILRDQYGIPQVSAITGKKLNQILKEKKLAYKIPEDLRNLIQQATNLRRHLKEHEKDKNSRHGLSLIESKIHRLTKYYKSVGRLSESWRYDPDKARLEL
jgi:small subunit ribosomal protein S15